MKAIIKATITALAGAVMLATPVAAQDVMARYGAYIGRADLFNSKGVRLQSAAQILRQDRANFHRFGIRQQGDEWDPLFDDPNMRARMEAVLENSLGSAARTAIRSGGGFVFVEVFGYQGRISYIRVNVAG